MKKFCLLACVLLGSLACATSAFGEGYGLYEYSARAVALGGATVARKPDPSVVASNPALLARLPGVHMMVGASTITPAGKMRGTTDAGDKFSVKLKPATWVVPHAYYTHQINDDWTFGVGEFTRFGLGFEYPHDWPGRFNIYQVDLQSVSLNPNIAWAVTDKLSLAAGLEVVYVALDLKKRVNIVPGMFEVDSNIVKAEDVGLGYNLAGHVQINDQWAVGASFRSKVKVRAKGDVEYTQIQGQGHPVFEGIYNNQFKDGQARGTVVLPESFAMGVSYTPIPELSFETGLVWTRWSRFKSLDIALPDPIRMSENPKEWRNTIRVNAGVEYSPLDWLTLRAGYVYDQSPMREGYEDYLVPTGGRNIYSGGVGINYDAWTFDLAYAYIDAKGRSYSSNPDLGVQKSEITKSKTDIVTFTIGYEF